jgi:hypothetical protein
MVNLMDKEPKGSFSDSIKKAQFQEWGVNDF